MAATHAFISSILERMKSRDTDFRFMAVSDFETELQNPSFCMDQEAEKKICMAILKLLDDQSVEVQGKTVTCMRLLVRKIHENSIQQIVSKLVGSASGSKEANTRDIAVIGLNGVIDSLPEQYAPLLVSRVVPPLCSCLLSTEAFVGIHSDCMNVISHLLKRFGSALNDQQQSDVQRASLTHLGPKSRRDVRKLAIGSVANLSLHLSDEHFTDIVIFCLQQSQKSQDTEEVRTHIQLLGQISQYTGHRLGHFMDKIIPLISQTIRSETFAEDIELKEICFQTFEYLLERCPREIGPFLNDILDLGLHYLQFDPNYAGDIDGEMEEGEGEDEWGYESGESDDEFVYDVEEDDSSGKVRKACARMISSIATFHHDFLSPLHTKAVPMLIQRFSEREDYVRMDVFHAFVSILRASSKTSQTSLHSDANPYLESFRPHVHSICSSLVRQLSSKHAKVQTKESIFGLLREMALFSLDIFPEQEVCLMIPCAVDCLKEKQVQLKGIVLQFLRDLLSSHPPSFFHSQFDSLCQSVCSTLNDSHSKQVSADGLRVAERLAGIMRPKLRAIIASSISSLPDLYQSENPSEFSFPFESYVSTLHSACLAKLQDTEADSEVKECSIECMGVIIASLGDQLGPQLEATLRILVARMKNEVTRLASVRALTSITLSPLNLSLDTIVGDMAPLLASFLRKSNRTLRHSSLLLLYSLARTLRLNLVPDVYSTLFSELGVLLSDSDLQICHLSFLLVSVCLHANNLNAPLFRSLLYPKILLLLKSPLLHGNALDALVDVFPQFAFNEQSVEEILNDLIAHGRDPAIGKQSAISIAKCFAVTTTRCDDEKQRQIIEKFLNDIQVPRHDWGFVLSLLCLGEIGRRVTLNGAHADVVFRVIIGASEIENVSEEIKSASAFALGGILAGNMDQTVPIFLHEIQETPRRRYFLLHALKEAVCSLGASDHGVQILQRHLSSILPILMDTYCHSDKEGLRAVVAECLGRLALVDADVVRAMHRQLGNADPTVRCTMLLALRHVVIDKPHAVDQVLSCPSGEGEGKSGGLLEGFLAFLQDSDLSVRRTAMMTFTHVAHNKPELLANLLPKLLPILYGETRINAELQRQVEFGPFRHSVDDGLPIRKAAFECMFTLLDHCIGLLNLGEYLSCVVEGLKDVYDIKMMCHLILNRLAETQFGCVALISNLNSVIEPLRLTITKTIKETAVKQDVDRNEEQIRSALRAVHSISQIPHIEKHPRFREFLQMLLSSPSLRDKFESIRGEKNEESLGDSMDMKMSGSFGI